MVSTRNTVSNRKPSLKFSMIKSEKRLKQKGSKTLPKNFLPVKNEENNEVTSHLTNVTQKSKKNKYVMPSKSITEKLVNSCLDALEKLSSEYKKKKNTILDDETPIFAEIRCIKIQNSKGSIKFVLPHSTIPSSSEVCLITPDLKKGKKIDHEPTIEHWEEILRKANVTDVKTIVPMRQLKVEYDQFELKRRLLTQHDFIMVDTRILSHVSHLLGNMFFKKHNMLIPVRLDESKDIKKSIAIGLHTAMLRLNEGHTSSIVVGHVGMAKDDIKRNILALIKQLKEKYPGGEANIRTLCIKLPLSVTLPLYMTLRPSNVINIPRLKRNTPKDFMDVEDEISTKPGSRVIVAPDGTVHVKKINSSKKLTKIDSEAENDTEDEVEDQNNIEDNSDLSE